MTNCEGWGVPIAFQFIFVTDAEGQLVDIVRQGERGAPGGPSSLVSPLLPSNARPGDPVGRVDLPALQSGATDLFSQFTATELITTSTKLTETQREEFRALFQTRLPGDYIYFARDDRVFSRAGDSPPAPKSILIHFVDP